MTDPSQMFDRWLIARDAITAKEWECACCGVVDPAGPSALIWRDSGQWDALCGVCAKWIMRAAAKFIAGDPRIAEDAP